MENIEINFQDEFIVITSGSDIIALNNKIYTPDAAIFYALNKLGVTKFSEEATKANLEALEYYEDKVSNLNSLLNASLDLVSKLIKDNNSLREKIMVNSYGRG